MTQTTALCFLWFLEKSNMFKERLLFCQVKDSLIEDAILPAIVAAVSSANSRSFSSCRFSSSLWCFLCSSSITFWWDSSMAAKPLSQVAYETRKNYTTVSPWVTWTWAKGSPLIIETEQEKPLDHKVYASADHHRHLFPSNNLQATAC